MPCVTTRQASRWPTPTPIRGDISTTSAVVLMIRRAHQRCDKKSCHGGSPTTCNDGRLKVETIEQARLTGSLRTVSRRGEMSPGCRSLLCAAKRQFAKRIGDGKALGQRFASMLSSAVRAQNARQLSAGWRARHP
jgi:hypothetical protein